MALMTYKAPERDMMMHLPRSILPVAVAVARALAPPARYEPAARDGTQEDLPPADTERTAPVLIQQRLTGWVSRAGAVPPGCPAGHA
jgi:hypothetical protein